MNIETGRKVVTRHGIAFKATDDTFAPAIFQSLKKLSWEFFNTNCLLFWARNRREEKKKLLKNPTCGIDVDLFVYWPPSAKIRMSFPFFSPFCRLKTFPCRLTDWHKVNARALMFWKSYLTEWNLMMRQHTLWRPSLVRDSRRISQLLLMHPITLRVFSFQLFFDDHSNALAGVESLSARLSNRFVSRREHVEREFTPRKNADNDQDNRRKRKKLRLKKNLLRFSTVSLSSISLVKGIWF